MDIRAASLAMILIVMSLGALTSCWISPQQVSNIHTEVWDTKTEVKRLQQLQTDAKNTITTEIKTIAKKLDQQSRLVNSNLADFERRIQALEEEIRQARGKLEELKFQISSAEREEPLETGTRLDTTAPDSTPQNGNHIFKIAMIDYNKGNYNAARSSLYVFLKDYPDSPNAVQAQYYIANCYSQQKDYQNAAEAYRKTAEHFPASELAPEALIKAAECFKQIEEIEKAIEALELVLTTYPDYERLSTVKSELKELKENVGKPN